MIRMTRGNMIAEKKNPKQQNLLSSGMSPWRENELTVSCLGLLVRQRVAMEEQN